MGNEDLFDGERGSFDGERGGTSLRRYQIRGLEYSVFCAIGMAFPLVYVSQLCFSAEHRRNLTKHDSRNEERVSLYCLFVERSPSYTYVCVHICVSVRVGQYTFLSFEERIRQNIRMQFETSQQ